MVRQTLHRIDCLAVVCVLTPWAALAATDKPGGISGTVAPADKAKSIVAVPRILDVTCAGCGKRFAARANTPGGAIKCRSCGKSFAVPVYEAKVDRQQGRFQITGLTAGQRYDLIVETTAGRIEGIDLSPLETDLERLRRKNVTANPRAFDDEDRAAVVELITKVKQFENFVRPLYIVGHGDKATVLLEKARIQDEKTAAFHSEQGNEAIWRVEVWYFRKWYGGWERVSNVEGVLYRKRMTRSEYDAMNWVFSASLGGIVAAEGDAGKPVAIEIPDRLDPKLGRTAASKPAGE